VPISIALVVFVPLCRWQTTQRQEQENGGRNDDNRQGQDAFISVLRLGIFRHDSRSFMLIQQIDIFIVTCA
jgi:hypothetical protein